MDNNSLTYLFTTFSSKLRDNFEKQLTSIALHTGQVFILISLWQNDGQSQAELVKNLKVSAPTIYNMVNRMADSGFISIRKDANDARIMRIFLEEKGVEIKPIVEQKWQEFEDKTFEVLTETEKMMFSLLLQKLSNSITS